MNIDDQRKRTLDALERRFALAKDKFHQQPNFSRNGKNGEQSRKESDVKANTSAANPTNPPKVTSTASSATLRVKGRDAEADSLTYSHIFLLIDDEHLKPKMEDSSRKRTRIDQFLHKLLQRGDSAQKFIQGSRIMKLDNVILLDNYVQKRNSSAGVHVRALKIRSKRSRVHMSLKKLKKHRIFSLPRNLRKFDQFKPMHDLWNYVEFLGKIC